MLRDFLVLNYTFLKNNILNSQDYKKQYLSEFKLLTDQELSEGFNGKVRRRYFNIAISGYMSAMREEFDQRGIDYSAIGDEKSMSYANKIKIVDSLVILDD